MNWFAVSKAIHVGSVALLIGTLTFSTWLVARSGAASLEVRRYLVHQVIVADFVFTGVAVTLLFATGVANLEILGLPYHANGWAFWGANGLYVAIAVWLCGLVPLQVRMCRHLDRHDSIAVDATGHSVAVNERRLWISTRLLVLAILATSMVLMVAKPDLQVG